MGLSLDFGGQIDAYTQKDFKERIKWDGATDGDALDKNRAKASIASQKSLKSPKAGGATMNTHTQMTSFADPFQPTPSKGQFVGSESFSLSQDIQNFSDKKPSYQNPSSPPHSNKPSNLKSSKTMSNSLVHRGDPLMNGQGYDFGDIKT